MELLRVAASYCMERGVKIQNNAADATTATHNKM